MTVKQLSSDLYDQFNDKTDKDGKTFYRPSYPESEEVRKIMNAVYSAVDSYEYDEVHTALGVFSDATDDEDCQTYVDETEPDIYNKDLLDWMSDGQNLYLVDEVLSCNDSVIGAIQHAQGNWRRDIYSAVLDTLKEIVDESIPEEAEA